MGHSRPLFSFFSAFQQFRVNMFITKCCRWLELNCGPLILKATALPTEPQPLPKSIFTHLVKCIWVKYVQLIKYGKKSVLSFHHLSRNDDCNFAERNIAIWSLRPRLAQERLRSVWPDWAIFWPLGNFLKPLATINLPQSSRFLGNYCKSVKIIHFSSEIIFAQLL